MCLSSVGRLLSLDGHDALVDIDGRPRRVSAAVLVLEGVAVAPGDWLQIHTGFAVTRLDPEEAEGLIELRQEMAATQEHGRP
jgi:hydrogenase expression/formation protein HypC